MDMHLYHYLQRYVEKLFDVRKPLTSFQCITPSANMVAEPYYTSLCSLGRKDLVDTLLSLSEASLKNLDTIPAFKKCASAQYEKGDGKK